MFSKVRNFEIKLDSPDHTFSPGEIITGNVILDVTEPKRLRSFKVRFKGLAKVHWTRRRGSGKRRRTKHYRAEEQYFREDHYMIGEADGETIELPIGLHTFPFEFCLPHNIPSSFETTHGSIRYTIKAIIDRPWKFDHEISIPFTVETPYAVIRPSPDLSGIDDDESETLGCFPCSNAGEVKFNIYMPTIKYVVGEPIEAKIDINNTSSANVTKVKLRLEQVLKLHSTSGTKTESNIVQKDEDDRRFRKKDVAAVGIQVPSLPYSTMVHCSIIDVSYYVNIIICLSGWHCNIKKRYPIVIGSNAALNFAEEGDMTTIPATMPTAPYFSAESPGPMGTMPIPYPTGDEKSGSSFSNIVPTYSNIPGNQHYSPGVPLPLGFVTPNPTRAGTSNGSTEKPPPSYEEAMDMSGKH